MMRRPRFLFLSALAAWFVLGLVVVAATLHEERLPASGWNSLSIAVAAAAGALTICGGLAWTIPPFLRAFQAGCEVTAERKPAALRAVD